ncbi:hypothetical protein BGLA2_2490004 [Burkholderia gladioli]|nr:hypothetical protein BGLA2_2490004 [Burkholderia gladioli]
MRVPLGGIGAPAMLGLAVDEAGDRRAAEHPGELIPVEERESEPLRLDLAVRRHPDHRDDWQHQQPEPAFGGLVGVGFVSHGVSSCVSYARLFRCLERVRRCEETRADPLPRAQAYRV